MTEEARASLESLPLPIEVDELLMLAEEEQIARHHLLAAARKMEL